MARKLLSLVVALAVVLSSMSFAFAADPKAVSADVKDAAVKRAVEKLVAFGMVEGIDGKYVPDQQLKRSELTKLIVIALGLGPAADAAKGATQFSDVSADHWASGYITVAAGQGIVQGMGDGTFAPDSEVTFAQALTMLVRTLGYKDEFLKGVWPGNYLAKASEKGIYAGVSITPNGVVKRGDFAVMMSNCLDAKVVKVGEYKDGGVTYVESSDTTLLKDKMKLDKVEVRPVANARIGGVGTDKVTLKFMKSYTSNDGVESAVIKNLDATGDYTLASGVSADNLMGVAVYAYYSKDLQKIVYFEENGKSEVVWDGVDKFTDYDGSTVSPDVKLRWTGKTVAFKGGSTAATDANRDDLAIVYKTANGTTASLVANGKYAREYVAGQLFGRFIIEGGKVVFADLYDYESNKWNLMVKSVDAEKGIITYYDESGNEATLSLSSTYSGGYYIYDKSGVAMKLSDLKQWDVLCIAKSTVDSKDYANVFVFRSTKKGTVVALSSDAAKNAGKVELDGGIGWTDFGARVTFSKDDNATIEAEPTNTILNDFYNTSVVLVIDNTKKVRHIYGTTTASSNLYGIIKAVESSTIDKKVKLYLPSDESVLYSFEDQDDFLVNDTNGTTSDFEVLKTTFETASNSSKPVLAKYKLTKDGKIAKNSVLLYTADGSSTSSDTLAFHIDVTQDFGETTINAASDSYYATKDIKIFDVYGVGGYVANPNAITSNLTNLEVANWDNFKNKDVASGSHLSAMIVVDSSNKKNVNAMVLISDFGAASKDIKSAYLINQLTIDGDPYGWFAVYGESELKRYKIDTDGFYTATGLVKESAVMINVTSAGKVTTYANAADASAASGKAFSTVAGRVYAIDASNITIGTNSSAYKFQIASDAVVYVGDGAKTIGNIDVDDVVVAVMKSGVIQSVELLDVKQVINNQTFGTYTSYQPKDYKILSSYTKPGVTNAYYIKESNMSTAVPSTFFINPDGKVAGILQ